MNLKDYRNKKDANREQQSASLVKMSSISNADKTKVSFRKGDCVHVKGGCDVGVIERVDCNNICVVVNGVRIVSKAEKWELTNAPKVLKETNTLGKVIFGKRTYFNSTIDLHGLTVKEAIERVKSFLDDAYLLNISPIRIMHGKGEGILRNEVRKFLDKETNIKRYYDEDLRKGGLGITIVEL